MQASREKPGFMAVLQGPLAKGSREGALILAAVLSVVMIGAEVPTRLVAVN